MTLGRPDKGPDHPSSGLLPPPSTPFDDPCMPGDALHDADSNVHLNEPPTDTDTDSPPGHDRLDDHRATALAMPAFDEASRTTEGDEQRSGKLKLRLSWRRQIPERWKPALTLENSGSVARDHLASERTFLAYVRTSLTIASTGVGEPRSPILRRQDHDTFAQPSSSSSRSRQRHLIKVSRHTLDRLAPSLFLSASLPSCLVLCVISRSRTP